MTREDAKVLLPIVQAYAEGKEIEIFDKTTKMWKTAMLPHFDCDSNIYRIKPEPKYRPFKDAEECWAEMLKHKPFGWVVDRRDGVMYLIRCLEYVSVYTSIQYSFKDAFDKFAFADLVPFGVKVEE